MQKCQISFIKSHCTFIFILLFTVVTAKDYLLQQSWNLSKTGLVSLYIRFCILLRLIWALLFGLHFVFFLSSSISFLFSVQTWLSIVHFMLTLTQWNHFYYVLHKQLWLINNSLETRFNFVCFEISLNEQSNNLK